MATQLPTTLSTSWQLKQENAINNKKIKCINWNKICQEAQIGQYIIGSKRP